MLMAPMIGGDLPNMDVWSLRLLQIAKESIIVAAGDLSGRLYRLQLANGRQLAPLQLWDVGAEAVSAIAVGKLRNATVIVAARQDDSFRVWNVNKARLEKSASVGHTGWHAESLTRNIADSIACGELRDGTSIILCPNLDCTIRVVATKTGEEVGAPLAGHKALVSSVRFGSLKGDPVCVSASWDGTLRLWDLTLGRQIAAFTAEAPVRCCEIDSESGTVIAGDRSGAIHILKPASLSVAHL
jgi:WD40 repeat protein